MLGALVPPGTARAEQPSDYADFNELDLESLLDQTITTASKYEQKVSESPVAATVITAEEIAASGARNIPEVLDRVPGLDVIQTTSSSYDVSARGLNKEGSNTMLVMIDGRAVYLDLYSITPWGQLPVSLEDIRAIEVVLGPGSVMYGANAFAGVINIITFTADEKPGNTARVMASDRGEAYGSLRHADRRGNLSWKLTSACDRADSRETNELETEICRFSGSVAHDLGDDGQVALSAGVTGGKIALVPSGTRLQSRGNISFVRADYRQGGLEARWYLNSVGADLVSPGLFADAEARLSSRLHDFEIRHSSQVGTQHFLLYGGSYRHQRTAFDNENGDVKTDSYAGFIHDEWRAGTRLTVSAGVRYDHHPQVGGHWAPRGGLVFKPHPEHALRLTFSRAYRDPTYVETYWRTEFEMLPGYPQVIRGDRDIQSETISALELGYQGLVVPDVLLQVAVFRNDMDDLISPVPQAFYPPPLPAGVATETVFENAYSWTATGGEFGVQTDPWTWLRLGGSYAYVWLVDADTDEQQGDAVEHHARIAATLQPGGGHRVQLVGRYRSAPPRPGDSFRDDAPDVEDQFLVDFTWSLGADHRRLVLGAQNIFDERVRDSVNGIEHRRRILMSLAVDF